MKQPFTELTVSGKKKIELRKWNTKFRGEFLVHASMNPDASAMKKFEFKQFPLGCIVGKATIVDVKHYANDAKRKKDVKLNLIISNWKYYGFISRMQEGLSQFQ